MGKTEYFFMSFSDPQSVTVNAVAQSLPNIARAPGASIYRKDDGTIALKINHTEGKRNRRTVRLDFAKIAANPFEPAKNDKFTGSVYVVIDAPPTGFVNSELQYYTSALTAFLSAANILKILGGES
jgi:hypothetical protein